MEWYKTGAEGEDAVKEDDEKRRADFDTPMRFWLKPDTTTKLAFLDTTGFFFREHQLKIGGSWLNWETCIEDLGDEDCPICEAGFKYSYVCAFSIIDLSKYTNKAGKKVTASKKLLILKSQARKRVLKRKEKHDNDLVGCVFEVTRFTARECNTGEDFDYLSRVKIDELKAMCPEGEDKEEFVKPYDYIKMFQPKDAEALRKVIRAAPPVGSGVAPDIATGTDAEQPSSLKDLL